MKNAYYFSHDSNAKTDEKILELRAEFGWEGYGIYWALIETLHDSTENKFPLKSLNGLSINLGVKKSKLEKIISSFGLFELDEDFFWSESLIKRMQVKREKTHKAKESAKKRWSKQDENALQTHSECITNAEQLECEGNALKESKGKERKVKENILTYTREVAEFFGIREVAQAKVFQRIYTFLEFCEEKEKLRHFENQFEFYRLLKQNSGQELHRVENFIGTYEKDFEDGKWNAENWEHQYGLFMQKGIVKTEVVKKSNVQKRIEEGELIKQRNKELYPDE